MNAGRIIKCIIWKKCTQKSENRTNIVLVEAKFEKYAKPNRAHFTQKDPNRKEKLTKSFLIQHRKTYNSGPGYNY